MFDDDVLMTKEDFKEGELVLYKNGDRYEVGEIKSLRDDGAFVYYSTSDTAAKTSYHDMRKLTNGYAYRRVSVHDGEDTAGYGRMREDSKEVTWRNLKVGQEVHGWSETSGNMHSSHMASAVVVSANPADVVLRVFDKYEERVPAESTMFTVKMTPEEFRARWREGAEAVIAALQVEIPEYQMGYHEMANGFLDSDPFEMAASLHRMDIKLVGVGHDIIPRSSMIARTQDERDLDVGLVVEEDDGQRWWVHYRDRDVKDTLAWWRGEPTENIRPRTFEL